MRAGKNTQRRGLWGWTEASPPATSAHCFPRAASTHRCAPRETGEGHRDGRQDGGGLPANASSRPWLTSTTARHQTRRRVSPLIERQKQTAATASAKRHFPAIVIRVQTQKATQGAIPQPAPATGRRQCQPRASRPPQIKGARGQAQQPQTRPESAGGERHCLVKQRPPPETTSNHPTTDPAGSATPPETPAATGRQCQLVGDGGHPTAAPHRRPATVPARRRRRNAGRRWPVRVRRRTASGANHEAISRRPAAAQRGRRRRHRASAAGQHGGGVDGGGREEGRKGTATPTARPLPPPGGRSHHAGRQSRRVRCRGSAPGAVPLRAGTSSRGGRTRLEDAGGGGGDAWQGTWLGCGLARAASPHLPVDTPRRRHPPRPPARHAAAAAAAIAATPPLPSCWVSRRPPVVRATARRPAPRGRPLGRRARPPRAAPARARPHLPPSPSAAVAAPAGADPPRRAAHGGCPSRQLHADTRRGRPRAAVARPLCHPPPTLPAPPSPFSPAPTLRRSRQGSKTARSAAPLPSLGGGAATAAAAVRWREPPPPPPPLVACRVGL